jgi:hypothetical protein
MKKSIRLTESDLNRLVKRIINEESGESNPYMDELFKNIKSGFCKTKQIEKPRVRVQCDD